MTTATLLAATLLAFALAVVPPPAQPGDDAGRLDQLFKEYDRWELEEFPERAMRRGVYDNADRLTDESLDAIDRRHRDVNGFLIRLRLIERSKLRPEDQLSYDLFEITMGQAVEGHRFRTFLAPIGARSGPQEEVAEMADHVRFESVEDYVNYVRRLEGVPRTIDDIMARLKLGLEEGRVPPKATMDGVPEQFQALIAEGGLECLEAPFQSMPEHVAQAKELRKRFEQVARPAVVAALARLGDFLRDEYIPRCRDSIAATGWPDGAAFYAHQLRVMTTTDLTPHEIHELGLSEVARIRREMMDAIRTSDFLELHPEASSLQEEELFRRFLSYLRTDDRFYHDTPRELLDGYRAICKTVDGFMPRLFGRLPRLPYGIKEIPESMGPRQTTAYYMRGDLRNHEAGYFYANTYQLDQRPKYEMIALAMHEAVPGHHHQISLALELEELPEFRKESYFTAYGEGWALYAERLGLEMGLYADPYDNFGRLLYEMWRACRLVVDPGMHAMGWSRQQAIDFMIQNTALSELNIRNEVDRYIAWPGQATAYKIGELKIRELRNRAEEILGERFNVRDFHDVVLEGGSIPLDVLEKRVTEWMNRTRMEGKIYD